MTEQKQTEQDMLMEFIHDDCIVDIDKKIEYPPVALSYGEKLIQTKQKDILVPIALGTYGNLSVITAPPKTMKTFFVSLLASAFLSNSNIYVGNIKGHRGKGELLHIDTEQGVWHCSKVFKRPLDMDNNIPKENYHHFALRTVGYKERLQFIEWFLKNKIEKQSLVIIDGVADLCGDVNNIEQSNELVAALMRISTQYNCHIINVIHQNYGSQKLGTGHLGSALEKKAETVISLEANTVNKEWVTVKCGRSRGYCFDTFSFEVNDFGLPQVVNNIYDPLG
jgi:hypothetical protein